MHNLDLTIDDISKIEGKAACDIHIREGVVKKVKFSIAEYKRFYTQAIRGKDIVSIPQLTARICGTCSNAHLLCALKAVEDAIDLKPSTQTQILRKLLNFGLIIRDHALHLYVFVLPDLFQKDSILDFDEKDTLEHKLLDDTFQVKRAGNLLGKVVGGRSVHAPFLTVGGFIRLPKVEELRMCKDILLSIRPAVLDLIKLFATKDFHLEMKNLHFSALCDDEYSFLEGDILKSDGSKISSKQYGEYLQHKTIPYSHASGYTFDGKMFMVGALARLNLAKEKLHQQTKEDIHTYLDMFPSENIHSNNLAQAIEILHAIDCSVELIENINLHTEKPLVPVRKKGIGIGIIEAPRGTLFYKLEVDEKGKILHGQIVVPTGQNQICIEKCIQEFLQIHISQFKEKEEIELEVEKIVRAFDPCMSCASHFLKIKVLQE